MRGVPVLAHHSRRRWLVAAAAGAVLVLAAVAVGLQQGYLQLNRPSTQRYPVRGVDVSAHQGSVDWAAVRADGYTFAYLKGVRGRRLGRPEVRAAVRGGPPGRAAGGRVPHFTFCRDGATQARNHLAVAGLHRPGDLPPVVDLEFGGNCSTVPRPADLDREFGAFRAALRAAGSAHPPVYVTHEFADRYLTGAARPGRSGNSPSGAGSPESTARSISTSTVVTTTRSFASSGRADRVLVAAFTVVLLFAAGCTGGSSPAGPTSSTSTPDPRAQSLIRFLQTDPDWLRRGVGGPNFGGRVYCGVDLLGASHDGARLYLGVHCLEFYRRYGVVTEGAGTAVPVLASVTGTGAATSVTSWRVPQDGSGYGDDVRAMFPAAVAERALDQDVHPVPSPEALKAAAARDLPAGARHGCRPAGL
jgi:lysozyme